MCLLSLWWLPLTLVRQWSPCQPGNSSQRCPGLGVPLASSCHSLQSSLFWQHLPTRLLHSKQRDIQYHTGSMCSPYWLTLNLHIYNLFLSPMTAIAQHSHTSWSGLTKRRFFSSEWSVISQVEFYWEIFLLWEAEHLRQYSVRTLRHGQSQPSPPPGAWKPLICMALLLRGSRGYFDTERQNSLALGPFYPSW